jgi:hypothetical protein
MSNSSITSLARAAALAVVLVVPAVSAFAEEPYYANTYNPVPGLSGPKIYRSDVRVIATALNPHPELVGQATVSVANATSNVTPKK